MKCMIDPFKLAKLPIEALNMGLFYLRNKEEVDLFKEMIDECENCNDAQLCSDHLKEAYDKFF